jgi:hypothetical protein
MNQLNPQQAYQAMFYFLEQHYNRTQSDAIGALLGSMSLLQDGSPADPALWQDWEQAVDQALDTTITDIELKLK